MYRARTSFIETSIEPQFLTGSLILILISLTHSLISSLLPFFIPSLSPHFHLDGIYSRSKSSPSALKLVLPLTRNGSFSPVLRSLRKAIHLSQSKRGRDRVEWREGETGGDTSLRCPLSITTSSPSLSHRRCLVISSFESDERERERDSRMQNAKLRLQRDFRLYEFQNLSDDWCQSP